MIEGFTRAGMVTDVRVREYEDEAKYLEVTVKVPTEFPIAGWQSSTNKKGHVDEVKFAMPLYAVIRPGDVVGVNVAIETPRTEDARFRKALEASNHENGIGGEDEGVEVLVTDDEFDDEDEDDDEEEE